MPLPLDNLSYPVKVSFQTGESGSGFLLNYDDKKLFLITAKHVIYKKHDKNELILHGDSITIFAKDKDSLKVNPIKINVDLNKVKINISEKADICGIFLADLNKDPDGPGGKIDFCDGVEKSLSGNNFVVVPDSYLLTFDQIQPSTDIFVLGYPVSIGSQDHLQIDYDQPLARKGIVAGKNHRNKTVILDCPVYPGNSGGLAIQVDQGKCKIIGIVTEFIPFFEIMYSVQHKYTNRNLENSGYSVLVPADHIVDLVHLFKAPTETPQSVSEVTGKI